MCRPKTKLKLFFFISITMVFTLILTACGNETEKEQENTANGQANNSTIKENPIVTITMENDEQIIAELYPEIAPNTVANFIALIEDGFYNELIFHRVLPGFMIQGGDPDGIGTGGPDYSIPGEFLSNGFENELEHNRGVLSMARSSNPDSAGSQFFIMVDKAPHLDGDYAAFGKVIEGIEVVDKIVAAERDELDKPLEDQRIKTIMVDTKGHNYPAPQKIND